MPLDLNPTTSPETSPASPPQAIMHARTYVQWAVPRDRSIVDVVRTATSSKRDPDILKRAHIYVMPTAEEPAHRRPSAPGQYDDFKRFCELVADAGGVAPLAYLATLGPHEPAIDSYDLILHLGAAGIILDNASEDESPAWAARMIHIQRRVTRDWGRLFITEATRSQYWINQTGTPMYGWGRTLVAREKDGRFMQPGQWPMLVDCNTRKDPLTGKDQWPRAEAVAYSERMAWMGVPVVLKWHEIEWRRHLEKIYEEASFDPPAAEVAPQISETEDPAEHEEEATPEAPAEARGVKGVAL